MKAQEASAGTFFAQLLCDIMIPAEFSAAIRVQGYDVAEARALPVGVQQDDRAILAEAARQRRAVITCNYSDPNSNFYLIHEEWRTQSRGARGNHSHTPGADQQSLAALGCARPASQLSESTYRRRIEQSSLVAAALTKGQRPIYEGVLPVA